jgi:hypothetical protein
LNALLDQLPHFFPSLKPSSFELIGLWYAENPSDLRRWFFVNGYFFSKMIYSGSEEFYKARLGVQVFHFPASKSAGILPALNPLLPHGREQFDRRK